MVIYVDDLITRRNALKDIEEEKTNLLKTFEIIDLDLLCYCIGILGKRRIKSS